jgi:hypothetical protein
MNEIALTSCFHLCSGRLIGVLMGTWLESLLYIDSGLLIFAVIINLAMIIYAFLTDVFNLFNEGLTDKLNDIEIIDLSMVNENDVHPIPIQ